MPFMIEDGMTGALVDPNDTDDIARGLVQTLGLELESAAARSREIANARFRGDVVAEKTAAVYREVLGRPAITQAARAEPASPAV